MTLLEAIDARHSVRQYLAKPIEREKIAALKEAADSLNAESGLRLQIITDEPKAFSGPLAHYGHFTNVTSYIACVGKKGSGLNEQIGYYGEQLVLLAQQLGLNTCWVALTASKRKAPAVLEKGEKMPVVIALGYGETQGHARKTKSAAEVSDAADAPAWYQSGIAAALKAPTATNQQRFLFRRSGSVVTLQATGGFYSDMDRGIVKLHFELGAGKENFTWG
jgi:hypothetical protein